MKRPAMRLRFCGGTASVLVLTTILLAAQAAAQGSPTLKVGDRAPKFHIGKWYKGQPFSSFRPGHVYVIDFWATRCGPCVAGIPHLSRLAARYRDAVTVAGVSVQKWQDGSPNDTRPLVAAFMKTSTGKEMHYNVAADTDSGTTVKAWMGAAGFDAIPTAFVVGKTGRIAWMGDPTNLDPVLARIVASKG